MAMNTIFNISIIILGIIQIIMIIKFFEIADDIKNIRRGFDKLIREKQVNTEDTVPILEDTKEKTSHAKDLRDPSKFTWQSWVMIIIIVIITICYLALS
nr:MAG TPA: hypothetical protein [Caudoviricetes sp.]